MTIDSIKIIPFFENIAATYASAFPKPPLGEYFLFQDSKKMDYFLLDGGPVPADSSERKVYSIKIKNTQDRKNLENQLFRSKVLVCKIKTIFDSNTLIFDLYVFVGGLDDFGTVNLLLAPEIADEIKITSQKMDFDKKCERLAEQCTIELGGERYFIIRGNYEQNETEDNKRHKVPNSSFSILCKNENSKKPDNCYAFDVQEKKLENSTETYFSVTRLRPVKNLQTETYQLIKGKLSFQNEKKAVSILNHEKLRNLLQNTGSYLKAWEDYTTERGNKTLFQARNFGQHHYETFSQKNNTVILFFKEKIEKNILSSKVQELVIYDSKEESPLFLKDKNIDFLTYCKKKEEKKGKKLVCPIIGWHDNTITISINNEMQIEDIPKKGYVVMSMQGEEIQIDRQKKAWQTIANGNAGISHLGHILEGDFNFISRMHKSREIKITRRVLEKIFPKNDPTDKQKEAIQLALNTPDICLIQGPPGTGKTTACTATLELLNEQSDKRHNIAGHVLATSYQHDAVKTMIDKILVNGLPTWKFGKKYREAKNYTEHIEQWCTELESRVKNFNPSIQVSDAESSFQSYMAEYLYNPFQTYKRKLLEHILKLPISQELTNRTEQLLKESSATSTNQDANILRKIRALRVSEETFADDGLERTKDLFFCLEGENYFEQHTEDRELLEKIAQGKAPTTSDFRQMSALQKKLLEFFSPNPFYLVQTVSDEMRDLCIDVANYLTEHHSNKNKREQIIADWMQDLQAGSDAFQIAIKEYDFVYAASSQQSVAKEIIEQKKWMAESRELYRFKTVIIDEAARATPPDLLIPMCLASERIILVGDHRQLPQLVDDEICNAIAKKNPQEEEEKNIDYEKAYTLSLFEILFKKLKELEKKDGIKRTITLNKQYRTHPILGNFCSQQFYEPHGEGYESPLPAEYFTHSLPDVENKAAVWIDVDKEQGPDEKKGTSRQRECEADCIVEQLLKFTKSTAGKNLSYGIITFYRAQVDTIEEKLSPYDRELKDYTIKVGTVDAFQGMEFDVVFLSIVRTDGNIDFLTPNRLCVSMSRQKKLLVAVGSKDFITSEAARQTEVPALANFYDLCNGKNDKGFGEVLQWKKS